MQIAVLEEQKTDSAEDEAAEKVDDEAKPIDVDADASTKDGGLDEKPDINDVPMEENQVKCPYELLVLIYIVNKKCCSYALLFMLCSWIG